MAYGNEPHSVRCFGTEQAAIQEAARAGFGRFKAVEVAGAPWCVHLPTGNMATFGDFEAAQKALETGPPMKCQECGWTGAVAQLEPVKDVWERVQPGDVMPWGDCPECGGCCFEAKPVPAAAGGPRIDMVCAHCGSSNVRRDAWAEWSLDDQDWVLGQVFDMAYCEACECETSLIEMDPEKAMGRWCAKAGTYCRPGHCPCGKDTD